MEKVAVLSDIHGNLRALEAVLDEVEREKPEAVVVCGDVASGPFVGETLERLMEPGRQACFVRANAGRETIGACDRPLPYDPLEENPARRFAVWGMYASATARPAYVFERAAAQALAAGYPDLTYRDTILTPPGPEEVAACFEEVAAKKGERMKKGI
ncbi:MAG: metallophosphoesterase family protein [Chloroflexi bacterium]|nr:metallophosphoesterase family protein [Chloroflexota bacterium]